MQTTRRDFVTSFAAVGPLGAATFAMLQAGPALGQADSGATMTRSRFGKGPALYGPYLDLRTGRGNQLAYARIQGDLDPTKQKYFWFKGYLSAVRPGKKIEDLVGTEGFGVIRLNTRPDGVIERMCREVILYTDLKSGDVLQEWKNPYLNETVKVVQVSNDPFNYLIEEYFPQPPSFGGLNKEKPPKVPFVLPWYQHNAWLAMETHIHLAYPSALQPDKWPRESAGPVAQVSEYFAHHVLGEDMQNEKLTTVFYQGTWNRITPWLPWMLMGQMPGHVQYNCFMGTTPDLSDILSKPVMDYAQKNYAKFFNAPETFSAERSLSSLENYAREQKPAPAKPAQ
jgi:hypothetical protein